MDCKKLYIVFTFSFLPKKSKTCLMWHVFAPLLGEFFITEPLTHLLHWSIFFSPVKLCHSLAKFTQKGRDTPPPRIYLSFKFWHMLKCNRTTWNPGSYFLGKYSNHKATAQNGEHYHKAHFLLLRTTAKETNWHHFIQTSHSSVSIRHYWECLLDYRELIKTPSSWILSWFVCVRRTRRCLDSPSLQ